MYDWDRFSPSDSTFNLVTEAEKNSALSKLKAMDDEGTLAAWFEAKDKKRREMGQTVTVYAVLKA